LPLVDARALTFTAELCEANTAGMNPSIRTLLLGAITLSAQPGSAPTDGHTFSTSARRGLHTLALTTNALASNALVLPHLETLNINSGALVIAARSFSGLPLLTCINCGGVAGLANLSSLGLSSANMAAADLLTISGIDTVDLTANALTIIEQYDFYGAPYLVNLYIGRNPSLTFIHCLAFTAEEQPLLTPENIDETGNPPSTWRAGCPSPSPSPLPNAGTPSPSPMSNVVTPTPTLSATPSFGFVAPAAGAGSGSYKPDMFAAALALGLLSVAFILALLFCRNALCCRCCCCCAGARKRPADKQEDAAPVKGGDRRIVLNLAGEEDSAATASAKMAIDTSITVNSAGGGFVLYGGATPTLSSASV